MNKEKIEKKLVELKMDIRWARSEWAPIMVHVNKGMDELESIDRKLEDLIKEVREWKQIPQKPSKT